MTRLTEVFKQGTLYWNIKFFTDKGIKWIVAWPHAGMNDSETKIDFKTIVKYRIWWARKEEQ